MLNEKKIAVLKIDLTKQESTVEEREDLMEYMGGVGVGTKLLSENLDKDPVIFSIGAFATIYPVCTKTIATFISPLTGEWGESHAGGCMASAMRFAGIDSIVLTGKADGPQYLAIKNRNVQFREAAGLLGLSVHAAGNILRKIEPSALTGSILRVGVGGERGIKFASVNVDTYRHFGRLGLGYVLAQKNIKAMIIDGDRSYPVKNKEYPRTYLEVYKKVTQTEYMEKYHDLGTSENILPLNRMGALPTRNLQQAKFEDAGKISGQTFAKKHLMRKVACCGCQIGCIHVGLLREKFAKDNEYEYLGVNYDYELIYSLGSMLGIGNAKEVMILIDKVESLGLDSIATGALLAWATEAYEKKRISENETIDKVQFGKLKNYLTFLDRLIKGENQFYKDCGEGPDYAAGKYGGLEYCITLGKNPVAGYHTGYASVAGQAYGMRHSHLDNAGYSTDQKPHKNQAEVAEELVKEEIYRCMLNSLSACLFARKVYDIETIVKCLSSIGIEKAPEELLEIGKKILKMKIETKKRLGFKYENVRVPERFYETASMGGKLDPKKTAELLESYKNRLETL